MATQCDWPLLGLENFYPATTEHAQSAKISFNFWGSQNIRINVESLSKHKGLVWVERKSLSWERKTMQKETEMTREWYQDRKTVADIETLNA